MPRNPPPEAFYDDDEAVSQIGAALERFIDAKVYEATGRLPTDEVGTVAAARVGLKRSIMKGLGYA